MQILGSRWPLAILVFASPKPLWRGQMVPRYATMRIPFSNIKFGARQGNSWGRISSEIQETACNISKLPQGLRTHFEDVNLIIRMTFIPLNREQFVLSYCMLSIPI